MSELSQRASDRRDAEHIRDDGYRTDEERRLAGRYIALDDVLIAAEAKIERRNATYTKPGEGFVCFHCGERFLTYESAKEHFGEKSDAQPTCFATPSPTIAADDALLDNPTAFNTVDFRNELQPFLNDWLAKANRESQKHGFAESFRYDSNDRCLLDHILIVLFDRIRKALSTPNPTIAAPSTSHDCADKRHKGDCPHESAGVAPSNEVTSEMVEAAKRILFHETEECDEEVRLAIEAALKARKPADDGAGQ